MKKPKENLSIYKDEVLGTKGISKHIYYFDLVSDETTEDGRRVIVLKPTDKSEHLKFCRDLADNMVEALGEGDNKLLRKMLYDTLRDYNEKDIKDMRDMVVLKKSPVKYREGCFKLIIGDGRRKDSHEIMLVE